MTPGELHPVARRMRDRARRAEVTARRAARLGLHVGPAGLADLAIRARALMLAALAMLMRPVPTRTAMQLAPGRVDLGPHTPTRAPARPLYGPHSGSLEGAARAPGRAGPGRAPNLT